MAFRQPHPWGGFFINIDGSVGQGSLFDNKPDDVLLVQALLELLYNNDSSHKKRWPGGRNSRLGRYPPQAPGQVLPQGFLAPQA